MKITIGLIMLVAFTAPLYAGEVQDLDCQEWAMAKAGAVATDQVIAAMESGAHHPATRHFYEIARKVVDYQTQKMPDATCLEFIKVVMDEVQKRIGY